MTTTPLPEASYRFRTELLNALRGCTPTDRWWYVDPDTQIVVCPVCDGPLTVRFAGNAPRADLACGRGCAEQQVLAAIKERDQTSIEPTDPHAPAPLAVRDADLTRTRPPEWAWDKRIVIGGLNLIVGAEGTGKGTLAAWMIARLTRGELPGDLRGEHVGVGLLGDEDGFDGVWVPRLHVAGADLARVKLIERPDGGYVELKADRERLIDTLLEHNLRILYFDALLDNLGAGVDDWRSKAVRDAIAPLRTLARDYHVAAVGSMHPNKSGNNFRQLVAGSVAFNALSRSSLLLAQHPDDEDRRVLVRAKGNLSSRPEAVEFDIESANFEANGHRFDVPKASKFDTSELTADDLIAAATAPTARPAGEARTNAREIVAELLADGDWHMAADIIDTAEARGIYKRACQRAAEDLAVAREKRGFPAAAYWRLPQGRHTEMPHNLTVATVASVTSVEPASNARGDSKDREDSGDVCHLSGHLSAVDLKAERITLTEPTETDADSELQRLAGKFGGDL